MDLLDCDLFDGMQGTAAGTGDGAAAGGEALSVFLDCGHFGACLTNLGYLSLSFFFGDWEVWTCSSEIAKTVSTYAAPFRCTL